MPGEGHNICPSIALARRSHRVECPFEHPNDSDDKWLRAMYSRFYALRDQARTFDMVILDPPKFAPTAAQVERAARGYKDINLLAMKLLKPGGY